MQSRELAIYVFSFNRSKYLENCIRSVEEMAPSFPLYIIDDHSDDIVTIETLAETSVRHPVLFNRNNDQEEHKTGGLTGCMNTAINHAQQLCYKYALFLQDDMQLVRPISVADLNFIDDYFTYILSSIQLSTTFIRRLSEDGFLDDYYVHDDARAYIRYASREQGKSSFSDTGVFNVHRFHQIFRSFEVGEAVNSVKAKRLGLVCGRSIYPFMCWLPYPESYRGKSKNIRHRLFEYFGCSGFYPIESMSAESVSDLISRDPELLPIMEKYLLSPSAPRTDIWSTGGGVYNFECYNSIPARLYRVLRHMKSLLLALHDRQTIES